MKRSFSGLYRLLLALHGLLPRGRNLNVDDHKIWGIIFMPKSALSGVIVTYGPKEDDQSGVRMKDFFIVIAGYYNVRN